MNLLYVNDSLVDLFPNQTIAINIKGIEAGRIEVRAVSYTNSFTVPDTENNNVIFGYTNDERSRGTQPYRLLDFKLVQNGIETFKGKLIVKSYNRGYKIQLLEEIFDVFAAINNKRFKDLATYGITGWEPADIDSLRNTTDGVVSAIVYWGKNGPPLDLFPYNENFFLPSFYYHTAIKSILEATGFSLSGDILTDTRFTDLVIPFPGDSFRYPDDTVINYDDSSTSAGQSILSPTSASGVLVQWPDGVNGLITSNTYVAPTNSLPVTVNVQVSLVLTSISYTNATEISAKIMLNGVAVATSIGYSSSSVTITFNEDIVVNSADEITVRIYSNSGSSPTLTATLENTSTFVIDADPQTVSVTDVDWDDLWPEITCTELLQDFFVRFGIVYKASRNTIYLKTLEEIISDRAGAQDWSSKLVKADADIDFQTSVAQINYLTYNDQVNNEELGRGSIDVDNTILPIEKNIYASPFENCIGYNNIYFTEVNIADIRVYDSESTSIADFKNSPGLKLCTLLASDGGSYTFKFDSAGSVRSDYYMAYFVDELGNQTKDTGFEYFVGQFYSKYEAALQRNKIVVKYYYLTELDIQQYDAHKMIYDGEGYYLINKISNYIPNQITKCELFKVG